MTLQTDEMPTVQVDESALRRAWRALMMYRNLTLQSLDTQAASYMHLDDDIQEKLSTIPIRLSQIAETVEHNAVLLEHIAQLSGLEQVNEEWREEELVKDYAETIRNLKLLVLDWSLVGAKRREVLYNGVLEEIEKRFEAQDERIMVLGDGLGRLAWEIARLGYFVMGVEKSYIRMLMCKYILNGQATIQQPLTVFVEDEEIEIPDVDLKLAQTGRFGMMVGEIAEGEWDGVVSCFWTVKGGLLGNVRKVAERIKEGGVWINVGDIGGGVEVTREEAERIVERAGFRIEVKKEVRVRKYGGGVAEDIDAVLSVAIKE